MSPRDRLLALVVVVCWGVNFPMTALALDHFPPIFLVALRFALLAVPTLLFVPRPAIPWSRLQMVGVGLGILQFGILYLGMAAGMPSGSIRMQVRARASRSVRSAIQRVQRDTERPEQSWRRPMTSRVNGWSSSSRPWT